MKTARTGKVLKKVTPGKKSLRDTFRGPVDAVRQLLRSQSGDLAGINRSRASAIRSIHRVWGQQVTENEDEANDAHASAASVGVGNHDRASATPAMPLSVDSCSDQICDLAALFQGQWYSLPFAVSRFRNSDTIGHDSVVLQTRHGPGT